MAYENINTANLKVSLNDCLNSLNSSNTKIIARGLTDNIWSGKAKENLTKSIDKLVNVRYKELNDKIKEYLKVVDQIERYKTLNSSASNLQSQKKNKENELKNEKAKTNPDTSKINKLQQEINSLNLQINSKNIQMNSISINV